MRPLPETVQVIAALARSAENPGLMREVQQVADDVQDIAPDCIGLSLSWGEGITLTLTASEEEIALLDALQYLSDGPCVAAVASGESVHTSREELFAEESWRLFAEGAAAAGVRSTLTLPLLREGDVVGSVNLYGASPRAFEGNHDALAHLLGAWAPGAVRNADLSFRTRRRAERAPEHLQAQAQLDRATGVLAAHLHVGVAEATVRLHAAASRAGVSPHELAQAILRMGPHLGT